MKNIDIGKDFTHSLTNRDQYQRDGTYTGIDFRKKYLNELDNKAAWTDDTEHILLNFENVKRLGPSWANEVFAYFTKYGKPEVILKKIRLINISRVKLAIITQEINTGYSENK